MFGPPRLEVVSGKDVVDPIIFGIAADGYFFDGTSVRITFCWLGMLLECILITDLACL